MLIFFFYSTKHKQKIFFSFVSKVKQKRKNTTEPASLILLEIKTLHMQVCIVISHKKNIAVHGSSKQLFDWHNNHENMKTYHKFGYLLAL